MTARAAARNGERAPRSRALRVLMSNNYDMTREQALWAAGQGAVPSHHVWGAVELEELGHRVEFAPMTPLRGWSRVLSRIGILGDLAQELHVWRRRHGHDVLYCGNQNPQLLIAMLRRHRLLGLPIVTILFRGYGRSLPERLFVRRVLAGYDRLLCLSEAIRADMASGHPELADRLTFLPWGHDLARYDRGAGAEAQTQPGGASGEAVFVTAGKTFRDPGALIRAFASLAARLEIYYGPDHPRAGPWRAAAAGARPANVAVLEIDFEWQRIRAINRRARAVLVPLELPRCDRYPNAIGLTSMIDAMAAATPVIVTRTARPAIDVEAEGIGLFVGGNAPEEWARAVGALAADAELARRMGLRGRRLCERLYNMEAFSRGLQEALIEAASAADGARQPAPMR